MCQALHLLGDGPCANITSVVQTGRLPRPLLSPEPVWAHAERSVRMRREGLGRQANGDQEVMDKRWRGKAAGDTGWGARFRELREG